MGIIIYFNESLIKNTNDVKSQYKELVKKNHPDLGGCTKNMQIINNEYEILIKKYYGKDSSIKYDKIDMDYPSVINNIITLQGVTIEIIGSWVWVSGNTSCHASILRDNNFSWSKNKKAWFWYNGIDKGYKKRGLYSMNQIRNKFGVEHVETKEIKKLAKV